MTQEFYTLLTDIGAQKQAQTLAGQADFDLYEIAVGDGNGSYYEPVASQTSLKKEVWRGLVENIETIDNKLYCIGHIPPADGGFTIREMGVFDQAGQLIVIAKAPETIKQVATSGSLKQTSLRVDISMLNSAVAQLIVDPSIVVASTSYVNNQITALTQSIEEDFVKQDGTKPFTAEQRGVSPTTNAGLTTKQFVNGLFTSIIGALADLTTTAKDNIVAAINELKTGLANINYNVPCCINSGSTSSGEPNVLSYSGQVITLAAGTVLTLSSRAKVTLAQALTFTNTFTTTGTYHLYYIGGALVSVASRYIQKTQPALSGTFVWRDTSIRPAVDKYYNGTTLADADAAYCGAYTVAASIVSGVIQPQFNLNFSDAYCDASFDYNAGTISASGTLSPKMERATVAALQGAATIQFPKNAPIGARVQSRMLLTTSSANQDLTFKNAAGATLADTIWTNGMKPIFDSTSATYDITLESKDGGINVTGYATTIGI